MVQEISHHSPDDGDLCVTAGEVDNLYTNRHHESSMAMRHSQIFKKKIN